MTSSRIPGHDDARANGPANSSGAVGVEPEADVKTDVSGLGAVFTRPWAVDLVLDLAGYTADVDLAAGRATEPSCGAGAFLEAMVHRLAESCRRHGRDLSEATGAIRAWDLDPTAVRTARAAVRSALRRQGLSTEQAAKLAKQWVRQGDFLLLNCQPSDWVVGNPPYVRLEDVPAARSADYRERWDTMRGRADVYVGFIQAGLQALRPDGVLAFICADRWMRNQYGKHLRTLIEDQFAVDTVVTLHDSDAFEERVAAYPAVFAVRAGAQGPALVVDADASFGPAGAKAVGEAHAEGPDAISQAVPTGEGFSAAWTPRWFVGAGSWPTGRPDRIAVAAVLEDQFPALTDPSVGIRIGIGIASGADRIYLTRNADIVEAEQLLPLAMAGDLHDGKVVWSGMHLVNPWTSEGLIDLADVPRMRGYLTANEERLRSRHVGKRQPDRWYRTIDRPIMGLAETPKLLIPDLRHRVAPVLENEGLYPHHNLFWVTSAKWDLRVLGGLLLSDFATMFVETYSPRMAGGALRVTAQYLRRIRVPAVETIAPPVQTALAAAFDARDIEAATKAAATAYGLDRPEIVSER